MRSLKGSSASAYLLRGLKPPILFWPLVARLKSCPSRALLPVIRALLPGSVVSQRLRGWSWGIPCLANNARHGAPGGRPANRSTLARSKGGRDRAADGSGTHGLKPVFFSASSGTTEAVPFPISLLALSAAEEKCIGPFGCAQGRLFVGSRPLRVRLR